MSGPGHPGYLLEVGRPGPDSGAGLPSLELQSNYSPVQDLDRAQRMAMAAIAGRWKPSHSRHLLELGLERLAPRRQSLCEVWAQRTARD